MDKNNNFNKYRVARVPWCVNEYLRCKEFLYIIVRFSYCLLLTIFHSLLGAGIIAI